MFDQYRGDFEDVREPIDQNHQTDLDTVAAIALANAVVTAVNACLGLYITPEDPEGTAVRWNNTVPNAFVKDYVGALIQKAIRTGHIPNGQKTQAVRPAPCQKDIEQGESE